MKCSALGSATISPDRLAPSRAIADAEQPGIPMNARATELIARLSLEPHPEGGYYREIFRSADLVAPADGRGPRAALTTIYFLLPAGIISRWHRVTSDEVWHLYEGGPLEVLTVDPACQRVSRHKLEAHAPVCTVAASHW